MERDFENDVPIDDLATVLDLLHSRWGDDTRRRLYVQWRTSSLFPYLEIRHVRDFGDDDVHRFRVTESAAVALRAHGYVRGEEHWGYTDDRELRISDKGERYLYIARDRVGMALEFTAEEWIQHEPWGATPGVLRARRAT